MQIEETAAVEIFELMAELSELDDGDVEAMAAIEGCRHCLRFPNRDDREKTDDIRF